jgi:hypothetical protein
VLAAASVPYRVMLKWVNVAEWETFQRNAGHTGHVPIVVNPVRIAKKWQRQHHCLQWRRDRKPRPGQLFRGQ